MSLRVRQLDGKAGILPRQSAHRYRKCVLGEQRLLVISSNEMWTATPQQRRCFPTDRDNQRYMCLSCSHSTFPQFNFGAPLPVLMLFMLPNVNVSTLYSLFRRALYKLTQSFPIRPVDIDWMCY
jgi:hypothetical protein